MDDFIRFDCPVCGKSIKAKPEQAGEQAKCPSRACGEVVRVPVAQIASQPKTINRSRKKPSVSTRAEAEELPLWWDEPLPAKKRDSLADLSPDPHGQRILWPWFAGGGAAVALLIAVVIVSAGGNRKQPELFGTPEVATGPSTSSPPTTPLAPTPKTDAETKANTPTEKPKVSEKPKPPEADKENVLSFDKTRGIASFIPKMMGKLETGEELALFVLIAPKDGRTLDEELAAGHFRGDIAFRYSPLTKGSYSSGTIVGGGKVVGEMSVFYDLRDGKAIQFGLSNEDANGKVSAGVGVKKTVGGNYRFVRFVTPVSTLGIASGTGEGQTGGSKASRPTGKLSESEKKLVGIWTLTTKKSAEAPNLEVLIHLKEDRTSALVVKNAGEKPKEGSGTWNYADEKLNIEIDGESQSFQCKWTSQDEFTTALGESQTTFRRKKPSQ